MSRLTSPKIVRSRAMTLLLLSLVPLAAAGCVDVVQYDFVNSRPFDPPAIYSAYWSEVKTCAGKRADMARIEWSTAVSIGSQGLTVLGQWTFPHNIMLRENMVNNRLVVMHEMLHDLLNGDQTHSRREWRNCGLLSEVDARIP